MPPMAVRRNEGQMRQQSKDTRRAIEFRAKGYLFLAGGEKGKRKEGKECKRKGL
jgi:hypothetical protein